MSRRGYSKGPLCGIDNCPSRFWRQLDGHPVCEYGHVNTEDIEIDDEEEHIEAQTKGFSRRIKNIAGLTDSLAVSQRKSEIAESKKRNQAFGEELIKVQLECFQIILKYMAKRISEEYALDWIRYSRIVKRYWGLFLANTVMVERVKRKAKTVNKTSSTGNSKLNESEKQDVEREADYSKLNVNMSQLLILCYIGLVYMKVPVYYNDLLKLIQQDKIPFLRSENVLPMRLRNRLPLSSLFRFHGRAYSSYAYPKINELVRLLGIPQELKDETLCYFPLLTRTVLRLNLPLEIIAMVNNLIQMKSISMSIFDPSFNFNHKDSFMTTGKGDPELRLLSIIFAVTKVYFRKKPQKYSTWKFVYQQMKIVRSGGAYGDHQMINTINLIMNNSRFEDLTKWDNSTVDNFLSFFYNNISKNVSKTNISDRTANNYMTQKVTTQRLFDIFQIDPKDFNGRDDENKDNRTKSDEESLKEYKESLVVAYTHLYKDEDEILTENEPNSNSDEVTDVSAILEGLVDILVEELRHEYGLKLYDFRHIITAGDRYISGVK